MGPRGGSCNLKGAHTVGEGKEGRADEEGRGQKKERLLVSVGEGGNSPVQSQLIHLRLALPLQA